MAEGVLTPRNGLNELNRGDNTARRDLEGSATLQVDLNSYANAAATDFTWYIYNQLTPSAYGYYKEQSFHYQFSIFGKYTARVAAANITRGCIAQDSIVINVLESDLEIPNVFTPNGDGMNDKFCVAYKSLVSFKMWVYNRWGRLVFSSSDPSDCWDGSNGGAKSPTGAYYYVVEAMGADGIKYKKAGNINLLRGKD
jgi:gliding motility-associated-like protein